MKTHRGRSPNPDRDAVRTATVTIRFDPKLRYLTDVAARVRRQSMSRFIQWAIADALEHEAAVEATTFWDPDPLLRFLRLVHGAPALLTFREQVVWKRITENPQYWDVTAQHINLSRLREDWAVLQQGAMQ